MADIAASINASGRLPVIISSREPGGLFKAQQALHGYEDAVVKDPLPIIGGYTAEINPKDLQKLMQELPAGVTVTVDEKQQWIDPQPAPEADALTKSESSQATPTSFVIPTLGADKLWAKGFAGEGVGIAVIDTGIYPHPDFKDRIVGFHDVVNERTAPYDDQGHGTHVAGDAAGSGAASAGKYRGTAPKANLIGVKVLDGNGSGTLSDVIKGIQWAVENRNQFNIRVINMSLGASAGSTSAKDDLVCQAAERAVEAGIVTVVAAGNSGPWKKTVGTPGMDPKVLTVGASNDKGSADRSDDKIPSFSSRGPTKPDNITKPDVVAPGVDIIAANAKGSALDRTSSLTHVGTDYIVLSGTSMATPVVAGVVADLISAKPTLTPQQVKDVLMGTATPLKNWWPSYGPNDQGKGLIDPVAALARVQAQTEATQA